MRHRIMTVFLVVMVITTGLQVSLVSAASNYYVATNGDDSNPGTEAEPFRTIQRGADAARNPGDTVIIRSGTYAPFRIRYSGAENQYITFRNYPGERPVILGDRQGNDPGNYHNIVIQEGTSHWNLIGWLIIEGLEVANAGIDGIKAYNVHHLIIRNCDIHHSYANNILITGSHHVTIDSSRFHENSYWGGDRHYGHSIYATGNDYTVVNNLFYAGGAYGIQIAAYDQSVHSYVQPGFGNARRWLIANNTFAFYKDRSAIVVWDGYGGTCEDITIVNNIFYRNSESDVGLGAGTANGVQTWRNDSDAIMGDITIHHNLYFGQAPFITNSANAQYQEFDNMNVEPNFVYTNIADPGNADFHLQPTSPAIDSGVALSKVPNDFDGVSRPRGAGYDIGAYEYVGPPRPLRSPTRCAAATHCSPQPTGAMPRSSPFPLPRPHPAAANG